MSDPFKSIAWTLDNRRRTEIPDIDKLDLMAISAGKEPGIYSLSGPGDSRAFLTIYEGGRRPQVWGLAYDPEYLNRATGLKYCGTLHISTQENQQRDFGATIDSINALRVDRDPESYRGIVPEGQTCVHGNKDYCGFCFVGK